MDPVSNDGYGEVELIMMSSLVRVASHWYSPTIQSIGSH